MAGKFSSAIRPQEVNDRLSKGEVLEIVDVREADEWASGHISGARHIPLGSLMQRHNELNKQQETIMVCRSGNRSGIACEYLESLGYKVINMTGGMLEWPGDIDY